MRKKSGSVPSLAIDAATKRAWQSALQTIRDATERDASAFDEKYEAIAAIVEHEPPLYVAGGCANFQQFVQKYLHEDESLVRKWMDVAKHATPQEEQRYSPTRLAALLGLLRAQSRAGTVPDRIDWAAIRVPVRVGSRTKNVGPLEATIEQIRAAQHAVLRSALKTPPGETESVTAIREALAEQGIVGITVREQDGVLSFGKVPAYQLAKFGRALLAASASRPATAGRAKARKPAKRARGG